MKELKCTECGSNRITIRRELEYNDGADESHLSNHLVWVDYPECDNCGHDEFIIEPLKVTSDKQSKP